MHSVDRIVGFFKRLVGKEDKKNLMDFKREGGKLRDMDNAYTVSWNKEFEEELIKQCVTDPARQKELWDKEAEIPATKFREFLKKKKRDEEQTRN